LAIAVGIPSPEWKTQVGTSLPPKWPVGLEANGNDGVCKLVKARAGSIGYVEFIYALQNHLTYGSVRNRDGKFVSASLETIAMSSPRIVGWRVRSILLWPKTVHAQKNDWRTFVRVAALVTAIPTAVARTLWITDIKTFSTIA
jgi:ABC-type phosphate transport system substrate-binding protein